MLYWGKMHWEPKGLNSGYESAVDEMCDLILAESQHSGAQIPHL